MMMKVLGQLLLSSLLIRALPTTTLSAFPTVDLDAWDRFAPPVSAQALLPFAADTVVYPIKNDPNSYGIVLSAPSAIVVDAGSGMMLFGKDPDVVRPIGSITKLMTAIVFLETSPDLAKNVTLDATEDFVGGGRVYLAFNDPLPLRSILAASLVGSDNSATQSLARFSGMSTDDFVAKMNAKAKELKMERSSFSDPTGVDTYNMATARDIVKLLQAAQTHPEIRDYTTRPTVTLSQQSGATVTIENTDGLLVSSLNQTPYNILAGKTGYLPQAGYSLATMVEQDGHPIYALVLGASSKEAREVEVKSLAMWAFKTYTWP